MGLRVWSGGEMFGKKIKTLWGGHNVPPLIITKVNRNCIFRKTNKVVLKVNLLYEHGQSVNVTEFMFWLGFIFTIDVFSLNAIFI